MRFHSTIRKFGTFLALGAIIFAVTVGLTIFSSRFFVLKTIEVVGDGVRVEVDTKRLEKNLLFFPADTYKRAILANNPELESLDIQKKYPSTLVLVTQLRKPLALLDSRGQRVSISGDGIVLSAEQPKRVPIITIDVGNLAIGQRIGDPGVVQSLRFIAGTNEFIDSLEVKKIDSASLRAKTPESDILFPQNGDISSRIATLQTIVTGFRIKGQMPTYIDLRFDKPVIRN